MTARRWFAPVLGGAAAVTAVAVLWLADSPDRKIAVYFTSVVGRTGAQRHNAQLAIDRLNGSVIGPGETFSFTRTVGSMSRDEGFRRAPVSYNGTLIDDWGGGACQTSTTLYNAALLAGLQIVERHPHRFAPSYVPPGRDAAVAFSNIDLKLRNPYPFPVRIAGSIRDDRLAIGVYGPQLPPERAQIVQRVHGVTTPGTLVLERTDRSRGRIRNSGKAGSEVATYRIVGDRKELLSLDSYPVMDRVVERPRGSGGLRIED